LFGGSRVVSWTWRGFRRVRIRAYELRSIDRVDAGYQVAWMRSADKRMRGEGAI